MHIELSRYLFCAVTFIALRVELLVSFFRFLEYFPLGKLMENYRVRILVRNIVALKIM